MIADELELGDWAVDIIGLYLHLLQHAAVFCVHERSPIQVPDGPVRFYSNPGSDFPRNCWAEWNWTTVEASEVLDSEEDHEEIAIH